MAAQRVACSVGCSSGIRQQPGLALAYLGADAAGHVFRSAVRPPTAAEFRYAGIALSSLQCAGGVLWARAGWQVEAAVGESGADASSEAGPSPGRDQVPQAQWNRLHSGAGSGIRGLA